MAKLTLASVDALRTRFADDAACDAALAEVERLPGGALRIGAVPKKLGLIDNKTCSIDDGRSGIRFVVPRALRKTSRSAA